MKHYCREHEVDPEDVNVLPPELPKQTPKWAVDAAPMIADAETIEDFRQTLAPAPEAHDQLWETVQADREK
ncbi:hypothetical protein [Halocatena pleomorpha]|uniref:hypothetical protein n=1 Tax=Halocatena pleomorpha TaxID=1785090 RepID=UPI00163ACFBB|nr:hypothetical protein [Halocatena pleomorpha]